jgi:glycerophosphoryl diester phosphodiesterase
MKKFIICHRGTNREKENTYESIIDIQNLHHEKVIFGVEFDIQIIQDDTLVCYHDDTLERLHHDTRNLIELTSSDIKLLNIPTFDELLQGLSLIRDKIFLIESKINKLLDENRIKLMCHLMIKKIKEKNLISQCLFISFDDTAVLELLKIDSSLKIGKLLWTCDIEKIRSLKFMGINYFIFNKKCLFEFINQYKKEMEDINILTYTLFNINEEENNDDDEILIQTKNEDIGIITDNYKKVLSLLNI